MLFTSLYQKVTFHVKISDLQIDSFWNNKEIIQLEFDKMGFCRFFCDVEKLICEWKIDLFKNRQD